ncbi:MAG: adenine phosphoribosyltransferase, partial [Pseudomonadota bacterium]
MDKGPRDERWYLALMAPNTKGARFAWLDPTSIYINGAAFHDLLDDLMADLAGLEIDVVAGLDAMGFVLAGGLAARLGVGMLPVRKAGKLCVETDAVAFTNYSGRTQEMEMRLPAFAPGTRVLLVDQW